MTQGAPPSRIPRGVSGDISWAKLMAYVPHDSKMDISPLLSCGHFQKAKSSIRGGSPLIQKLGLKLGRLCKRPCMASFLRRPYHLIKPNSHFLMCREALAASRSMISRMAPTSSNVNQKRYRTASC